MGHVLAVDVGTSRVKASVLSLGGGVVAHSERRSPRANKSGARVEIDVHEVWKTLVEVVTGIPANLKDDLAAVGVTAQLGVCLLDSGLEPMGGAVSWQDRRAVVEAKELEHEGHDFVAATGRAIVAERMAPILRWYARHEPSTFQRISVALPLKDFLNLRLTGQVATDVVHAAYSSLFDLRVHDWSPDLLHAVGVSRTQVPNVFRATEQCGSVTPQSAETLGIAAGVPVVVSAPDGTAGVVGAGVNSPGLGCDMGGTSEVVFVHSGKNAIRSNRSLVVNPHPLGGGALVGGPMASMGSALAWVADRLGVSVSQLGALSDTSPPGARGLMFLPTFDGSRAPDWDESDRGGLVGLTSVHTEADIARAALEGVAFLLRRMVLACRQAGADVTMLLAVGAAARDSHLCQMKADVLGMPVTVRAETLEAGTRGVLEFCRAMLGMAQEREGVVARGVEYAPNLLSQPAYERIYEDYCELQTILRKHFRRIASA